MNKNEEANDTMTYGAISLVFSLIGFVLFLMPYFGILFSIGAIVSGALSKNNGMGIAGIVMGIIGTLFNGFFLVILLAIFGAMSI